MKKTIIVGVTSSIATFKSVQLVSDLIKKGYDVEVIMSKNATNFVSPLSFSSLTKRKTYVDTFDREVNYEIEHISLAKKADVFAIAPATANVIAKIANGICDDMLTTTFLAANCPKLIAPAMNTEMLNNPITQTNIEQCKKYNMQMIDSEFGTLACGDIGKGKLADIPTLINAIEASLYLPKRLAHKKVLISAGPTIEKIDSVRFISNYSSGKMGYALAKIAHYMGAEVTLVSGPTNLTPPFGIQTISVQSANDMYQAMLQHYKNTDIVIMAAAVSDFTPKISVDAKMKKTEIDLSLELIQTKDILATLGTQKEKQLLCGFAMETDHVLENAYKKFKNKHCDMLVVNDLHEKGAGFQHDTNKVTIITQNENIALDLMSKEDVAAHILNKLVNLGGSK